MAGVRSFWGSHFVRFCAEDSAAGPKSPRPAHRGGTVQGPQRGRSSSQPIPLLRFGVSQLRQCVPRPDKTNSIAQTLLGSKPSSFNSLRRAYRRPEAPRSAHPRRLATPWRIRPPGWAHRQGLHCRPMVGPLRISLFRRTSKARTRRKTNESSDSTEPPHSDEKGWDIPSTGSRASVGVARYPGLAAEFVTWTTDFFGRSFRSGIFNRSPIASKEPAHKERVQLPRSTIHETLLSQAQVDIPLGPPLWVLNGERRWSLTRQSGLGGPSGRTPGVTYRSWWSRNSLRARCKLLPP